MSEIPQDQVTAKDIAEWRKLKATLTQVQAAERLMRERVWKAFFTFKEGTSRKDLKEIAPELLGFDLVCEQGYDRKVDEATLDAMKKTTVGEVRDQLKALGFQLDAISDTTLLFDAIGVVPSKILRYKPELATREYKALTAEQRSIVDRFLEIKPSSTQLKVELNKEGKARAEADAAPKGPEPLVPPPPTMPPSPVQTAAAPVLIPPPPLDIPVFTQQKPPF